MPERREYLTFQAGVVCSARDQLLSYLPHPDTRAAIVLLIGNQDVTPVVEKTRQWLLDHPNCDDQDLPGHHRRGDFRYHATGNPAQPIRMVYLPFALTTSATGASTNRGLAGAATARSADRARPLRDGRGAYEYG